MIKKGKLVELPDTSTAWIVLMKMKLTMNNQKITKKIGWEVGCCGVIRCWECKVLVYCARLNIETCIACMKDCCYYCFENIHGAKKSRSRPHETLTAEQVGKNVDEIRTIWELQKLRINY